jgi:hypothetical protein
MLECWNIGIMGDELMEWDEWIRIMECWKGGRLGFELKLNWNTGC